MDTMESMYSFNGLIYKVVGTQDLHNLISNDDNFARQYLEKNNLEVVGEDIEDITNRENEEPMENEEPIEIEADSFNFTWDYKRTKLLVDLYAQNQLAFRDPKIKKRPLWGRIEREFLKRGYKNFSMDILDTKFRNMKKTFKTILDNKKRTGRGRISWPYYNDFLEIFKDDRTVNFGHTIASSTKLPTTNIANPVPSSSSSSPSVNIELPSPSHELATHSKSLISKISSVLTTQPPQNVPSTPTSSTSNPLPQSQQNVLKGQRGKKLYEFRKRQLDIEEQRVKNLRELKDAVVESNNIQKRRNELLERLVIAQEKNK